MTELAVFITAALVLVLVFRQRPVVWVSAGILVAVLFPVVVTRAWFFQAGAVGRIHPSAWIFLLGFVVTTVFSPLKGAGSRVRPGVAVAVVLWVAAAGAIVVRHSGLNSLGAFVVYYLTPPLAFLAIRAAVAREDAGLWKKIVPVVLAAASFESLLALLQLLSHTSVVFGQYYATNYWWETYLERSLGTFDSPLDLAAFLTMAVPLTAALRRTPAVYLLAGLFATGVVVSGSRTGVVLAAVAIVWIVFVRSSNPVPAIMTAATLGLGTAVLLSSPLASTLLGRFGFGGELSTQVRSDALIAGLDIARSDVFGGHGSGYAYNYSTSLLRSSFEDAYLATAIDLGLLVGVALVLIQLWAVFSGRGARLLFRLPGVMAIIWGFSFSSFVSTSTFGTLSWTFIALSSIAGSQALSVADQPVRSGSRGARITLRPATPRTVVAKP